MENLKKRVESSITKAYLMFRAGAERLTERKDGFGMNEFLGIAAGLIIAAFVIIPGLRDFADKVIDNLTNWWNNTVYGKIFPTS